MRRFGTAILLLLVSACAPFEQPSSTASPGKSEARGTATADRTLLVKARLDQLLRENLYQSALGVIARELRGGLPERALAEQYLRALEGLFGEAEAAFGREDFARAGSIYRQLQDHYPTSPQLTSRLSRPAAFIAERLTLCSDRLMERGLRHYRAGELQNAVDIWKQILEFAPDHAARRAVETTALQLKNLQAVEAPR